MIFVSRLILFTYTRCIPHLCNVVPCRCGTAAPVLVSYGATRKPGTGGIWTGHVVAQRPCAEWCRGISRSGAPFLGVVVRTRISIAPNGRQERRATVQTPPTNSDQGAICQLLGTIDAQTAHPATFSTAPTHQLLGSVNAETTAAGAPAAAADRKQRPDATCGGKNG